MPLCPIHSQEMRAGSKPGNFYCTKFMGVGVEGANQKGYCAQAMNPPRAPQRQQGFPASPAVVSDPLAVAALQFAGNVFQGSGVVGADDALEVAQKAYRFLKGAA